MDSVSTAISLFKFAVQALNSMQLARTFEDDFARYQIKIEIMQLRLLRWGETIGIDKIDTTQPSNTTVEVKSVLSSIQHRLQKTKTESIRLGSKLQREENPEKGDAAATIPLDPESGLTDDFKRIRNRLKAACRNRKAQVYVVIEGVKWVIYKKESFDQLLESISDLMDRLEAIPDIDSEKLGQFCDEDCKGLDQPDLEKLDLAIDGCDPLLEKAIYNTLRREESQRSITMSYNTGHVTGIHNGDNKGHNYGDNSTITQAFH